MSRKLDYDFWSPAIRIDSLNSEINDLQPQYAGNEWMYWVRQRAVKNEKFYASQSKKIEPQLCPQSVFSLSGSFTTSDSATKAGRIIVNDVLHSVNIDTIWQPRNQTNYLIILPVGKMYSFQFSDSLATTHVQTVDTRSFTKNTAEQENVNLSNWIELECKVFEPEKFGNKVAKADFAFRDIDIGEKLDIFVREIAIGLYSMQLPVGVKTEISITKDNCQTYTEVVDLQGVVHFSKFKKEIRLQPNSKVLEVTVSDFLTNETLDAEIIITNTKNKEEQISKIEAARNGLAKATLRTNSRYLVEVLPKPQYFFNTTYIDINANPVARLDVKLRKMEVGLTLETYEIQFVAGSNELNPSSHSYLNRLAEMLTNNSQLKLQIALSSDRKEMVKNFGVLSETRLQTIFHYLQSKGVNNSQLATLVMPEYDAETTGIKTGNPVKVELKVLEL